MLSFIINSYELGADLVAHVNVSMSADEVGQTIDIQVSGTEEEMADPNYILRQIAMTAKAFASPKKSYGYNGETLAEENYSELPLELSINVL